LAVTATALLLAATVVIRSSNYARSGLPDAQMEPRDVQGRPVVIAGVAGTLLPQALVFEASEVV
jgi:hypothetical protein